MADDEIRLNLESLHANIHELYEAVQRHDMQLERLINIAADALQSVQSLERIATAHQQRLDEHDGRIGRLEDGK